MIAIAEVAPLLRSLGAAAGSTAQLIVVDHGDNTGASATIAGADVLASTAIYVRDFAGDLGGDTWQLAAIVSGNGDATLDLDVGHYFAYAVTSYGGTISTSAVSYFAVTDGLEAIHTRCLAAAQARIRALTLEGLNGDNVTVRKVPIDRHLVGEGLPAVVISPRRSTMPPTAGTNGLDDVSYDVLIAIFDRDNQEATLELNLDRQLLWREQIARAFRNQRLSGVPEVIDAAVESADGLLEDGWKQELMVSALLVRFTSRETRGIH